MHLFTFPELIFFISVSSSLLSSSVIASATVYCKDVVGVSSIKIKKGYVFFEAFRNILRRTGLFVEQCLT